MDIKKNNNKKIQQIRHRQAALSRINQGRHDTKEELLTILKRVEKKDQKIVNAIYQRLKIVAPKEYRKIVGPLSLRDPKGNKKCYCSTLVSLKTIADLIDTNLIPIDCLLCDDCWREDITLAWGAYGSFGAKILKKESWTAVCENRSWHKFSNW